MEENIVKVPYEEFVVLVDHSTRFRMLRLAHCSKKYGIPNDVADAVFGVAHGCNYVEVKPNAE